MLWNRMILPPSFTSSTTVTGWTDRGLGTSSSFGAWKHMTVSIFGLLSSFFSPGFSFLGGGFRLGRLVQVHRPVEDAPASTRT